MNGILRIVVLALQAGAFTFVCDAFGDSRQTFIVVEFPPGLTVENYGRDCGAVMPWSDGFELPAEPENQANGKRHPTPQPGSDCD